MSAIPKELVIEKLSMLPHPEGGYYVETYRSAEMITPADKRGLRPASTSILFLLGQGDISHLHRIKSDEIWNFHQGGALTIVELDDFDSMSSDNRPTLRFTQLGSNIFKQERLQHVVRANTWFGAFLSDPSAEYGLVGCTVSPGFDFVDFELAHRNRLLAAIGSTNASVPSTTSPSDSAVLPSLLHSHEDVIRRLTIDPEVLESRYQLQDLIPHSHKPMAESSSLSMTSNQEQHCHDHELTQQHQQQSQIAEENVRALLGRRRSIGSLDENDVLPPASMDAEVLGS